MYLFGKNRRYKLANRINALIHTLVKRHFLIPYATGLDYIRVLFEPVFTIRFSYNPIPVKDRSSPCKPPIPVKNSDPVLKTTSVIYFD